MPTNAFEQFVNSELPVRLSVSAMPASYNLNPNKIMKTNGVGLSLSESIISEDGSTVQINLPTLIGTFEGTTDSMFSVKANAGSGNIYLEEYSGSEAWTMGVHSDGSLVFYNDTTVGVTFAGAIPG